MDNSFKITHTIFMAGRGFVIGGEVEYGTFRIGDEIQILRDKIFLTKGKIAAYEMLNFGPGQGESKNNIAFLIKELNDVEILPGDIVNTTVPYTISIV